MLKKIIKEVSGFTRPDTFYKGKMLPDGFALPDSVLMFMHDWYPKTYTVHDRYMLIIPFIPVIYTIDDENQIELQPCQIMFSYPCQKRKIQKTYPDLEHGYPRLMITFDLPAPQYYLPAGDVLELTPCAEKYIAEMVKAYTADHTVELSLALFRLLNEISRHEVKNRPRPLSKIVRFALSYINSNPGRASLSMIAAHAKTSESNLRWTFRHEMGESIGSYVKAHKMKVAKYNLLMTSYRINEIAAICGFNSVYSFSHFFRKHAGMPPVMFRHSPKTTIPDCTTVKDVKQPPESSRNKRQTSTSDSPK